MKTAARKEDRLALANLDADFHEALMKAANNPVLLKLWQMLRPQLVIIFGLATLKKSLRKVVARAPYTPRRVRLPQPGEAGRTHGGAHPRGQPVHRFPQLRI